MLEKRELLAGDILATDVLAAHHNYWNPYDVNDDRQITARDALGVINYLSRSGVEGEAAVDDDSMMFYDVNADHNITAADALGVINAIGRGEEVGELVELLLTARDLNDQRILPDGNGRINLEVGQIFDLEVAYDDLRVNQPFQPPEALGVFQLFADIAVSQNGVLAPVLNETQRLIVDSSIRSVASTSVDFSIAEAPPGVSGASLTFSSPIGAFATNGRAEVIKALQAFGYTSSQFEVTTLDFGTMGDLGYQVHWVGDEFGNVDLPDISIDVIETNPATTVPTQTIEFAPFLADGVTPNSDAVRFNINSFSRTFNNNEQFYVSQNRGTFNVHTIATSFVPFRAQLSPDEDPPAGLVPVFLAGEGIVGTTSGAAGIVRSSEVVSVDNPASVDPLDRLAFSEVEYRLTTFTQFAEDESVTGQDSAATGTVRTVSDTQPFGFDGVGGLGMVPIEGGGIPDLTDDGLFIEPFDAFSLRVYVKSPVTNLVVSVNPGEDSEATLLYGRDDAVPQDMVLIETVDSNGNGTEQTNGTAQIIINATGNAAGVLSISPSSITVDEDAGTVEFTVNRDNGSTGAVNVDFTTANGTATAGSDYTLTSGTLQFANGELSKTITVPIIDDMDVENDETFTVTLSNPTNNATLGVAVATVTIADNDVVLPGALAFNVASATVDEGAGTVTLTVNRTGGSDGEVTVDFATADGSATAGEDYTGQTGTLTFADGDTSETIVIAITDDMVVEPDETFTVTLSNAGGGATLGAITTATVTITENDLPGVLAFNVANAEVNEDGTEVTLTVNRTGGSDGEVTVDFATADGTATAGEDYTGQTGTLTFANGDTSKTITIPITDDMVVESDETFTVMLSNAGGGATLGAITTTTVTIIDNDLPGVLAFTVANAEVNEDGTEVTLTVNRTGGSAGTVTVDFATADGTATGGQDFIAQTGTLTFVEGDTSETITIAITDDMEVEPNETFTVMLSNPQGGATLGANSTVTVTILEDDVPGILAFDPVTASVDEDAGTVTLTVSRTNGSDGEVTVDFATNSGTALSGQDFTGQTGTLTFATGVTSAEITIAITDDMEIENDETFTVTLTNPGGGASLGANSTATVTILEDDVSVSFDAEAVVVDEDAGTVTLNVIRTGDSDAAVSVDFATQDGTALAGADYVANGGTLNFAAGVNSQQITISITDDKLDEVDETFLVGLSNPSTGTVIGAIDEATVTIVDDDIAGVLAIQPNATVNEQAGTVSLTVSRTVGSDGPVMVQFSTSDVTATAGLDYTAASDVLTFLDGETTKTIVIAIKDDVLGSEPDETFLVTLSNPTGGATLGNTTATVTIINVNEAPTVSGPVLVDDVSEQDAAFTISEADLLANASDRESDPLSVSNLTLVSGNASGVTINSDSLSVDPSAYGSLTEGESASVVYSYLISDGVNNPISQTVTLTIDGFNDPPVARDDEGVVTFSGVTVNIDVLNNDDAGDGEDQALTVTAASSNDGTVEINADGTIDFTPAPNFTGATTVTYTVQDEQLKTDTATVFITVQDFRVSSISGSIFIDHVENLSDVIAGKDPIRNGVKDSDEDGLGGASVRLVSAANENSTGAAIEVSVLTDLEGNYTFEGLAPGTYHVIYDVPDTVIYLGVGELVRTIPETGDVDLIGLNFPILGTQGSALHNVDILASSYLRTNATMNQISNGGREGGVVSYDEDGNQEFVVAFSGFEGVKFAELAMSDDRDSALLTIIEEDGDVMSAVLTSDHFVVSADGRGVQFFGGINDLHFVDAADLIAIEDEYPTYRDAIDRVLAEL